MPAAKNEHPEAKKIESEDEVLDAVIIVRNVVDGQVQPKIMLNGNIQMDMVPGLLQIALRDFLKEMGLG